MRQRLQAGGLKLDIATLILISVYRYIGISVYRVDVGAYELVDTL
jgi:hypothetical protein